jgi:putative glycosyltransferase
MDLSIVTTLYYSAPYLEEFHRRICAAAEQITADFEIILVNDGSPDNALDVALSLYEQDRRVKVIDLSRNFGHHRAIMTGLMHAEGELVFLIDCDLEEAPELLNMFYAQLQSQDVDVVYGMRDSRKDPPLSAFFGGLFYRLFNALASYPIPNNLLTVRLMTRRYVQSLVAHREQAFIIAGLWALTGFKQISITVEKGFKGTSSYSVSRKFLHLMYGVTAFSNKPLLYIAGLGLVITIPSALFILSVLFRFFITGIGVAGWTTVVLSVWFLGGMNIFTLGVIGLYISVIFTETKGRPYTIIREFYNHEAD